MKALLIFSLAFIGLSNKLYAQNDYKASILEFQRELNEEFKNPDVSPLSEKQQLAFTGHDYYPIDEKFHVIAKFEKLPPHSLFQMKTTANSIKDYDIYGIATFTLDGKEYQLNIYQSHQLRTQEKYKDYLFLPFTDLTNGIETYGGGRYMGLSIPNGDTIELDFNKAYNPYCAYVAGYACPIPPKENDISVAINAGVMKPAK
ncbi:DUF1684 domain-containing protein [Algoriphagus winogradskyi]|uniref:DUF1684 domain-containing protein n=1 Tax=Algoriphagus winogradskyi TaxID=237017 RepID=A0ABY1NRA6_9BACT|nr:DUF1684 domain-containing protein [Algoriphagus winogradskyi]SMP15873.1 hypothetical protein SAMN06265367_102517 [Algoriphagus winogradskyi]